MDCNTTAVNSLISTLFCLQLQQLIGNMHHRRLKVLQCRRKQSKRRRTTLLAAAAALVSCSNPRKKCWSLPKGKWYEEVLPLLPEEVFRMHFRMSRQTFETLVQELQPYMAKAQVVRMVVPTRKRIAAALFRLSSSCELRTVAELFGVGISTIHHIFDDFLHAVIQHFYTQQIDFPTMPELKELSEGFEKLCGFPMAVGAIDGCHIAISPPSGKAVDYYNFKGWYSTILFALVDYKYRFRYISVGHPGRNHDAFIYANSILRHTIDKGYFNCHSRDLCGTKVNYVVLGDSAFPLLHNLMKPFPQRGELSAAQAAFNRSLSSGRRVVENAFGRLKARFRILAKRMEVKSLARVKLVIKACSVRHNILENLEEPFESSWMNKEHDNGNGQPNRITTKHSTPGVAVRSAIADYLEKKV